MLHHLSQEGKGVGSRLRRLPERKLCSIHQTARAVSQAMHAYLSIVTILHNMVILFEIIGHTGSIR